MNMQIYFRIHTHTGSTYQVESFGPAMCVTKVIDPTDPNWDSTPRLMVCVTDDWHAPYEGERWVARHDGRQVLSTSPVLDILWPRRLADVGH